MEVLIWTSSTDSRIPIAMFDYRSNYIHTFPSFYWSSPQRWSQAKWAMSETCDYQPMSHKITYARPYALLTRPQFWLTRRAWTYHDLRRAYADRFDSKRIGNAYARSVFRSCADAVIQEAVGNANLTWTPWLRPKSTGCQSWAMVYWDMVCLRTAYAQLTRSLREFTTPNL